MDAKSPTFFDLLSTPHGTLGTKGQKRDKDEREKLSTPHGTLGTNFFHDLEKELKSLFQLHTVH